MLYEDDFEFEEQPANIRDRAIPGKTGGGGGRGGNGGGGPRRGGESAGRRPPGGRSPHTLASERKHHDLPEDAKPARDLLRDILERMGLGNVDIHYIPRPEGEYLEVSGP